MSALAYVHRHFGVVVGVLLAPTLYFQGSGLSQLLAASWVQPRAQSTESMITIPMRDLRQSETSADAILSRNAFDSVTGPLSDAPMAMPPPVLDLSQPMTAPQCDRITAVIVTESSDPVWSVAALRNGQQDVPTMKRVGDRLGDREVAFIGYNSVQASPAVWLANETSLCQALLFHHEEESSNVVVTRRDAIPKGRDSSRPRGTASLKPAIANRIQKVNNTEFTLERSLVDEVLNQQGLLMSQVRVVPEMKNGETLGIRLFGIGADSLLTQLGLENGDRLDRINGFPLNSPEQALQAYAQLRTADAFALKIIRRGKAVDLDYKFR